MQKVSIDARKFDINELIGFASGDYVFEIDPTALNKQQLEVKETNPLENKEETNVKSQQKGRKPRQKKEKKPKLAISQRRRQRNTARVSASQIQTQVDQAISNGEREPLGRQQVRMIMFLRAVAIIKSNNEHLLPIANTLLDCLNHQITPSLCVTSEMCGADRLVLLQLASGLVGNGSCEYRSSWVTTAQALEENSIQPVSFLQFQLDDFCKGNTPPLSLSLSLSTYLSIFLSISLSISLSLSHT